MGARLAGSCVRGQRWRLSYNDARRVFLVLNFSFFVLVLAPKKITGTECARRFFPQGGFDKCM